MVRGPTQNLPALDHSQDLIQQGVSVPLGGVASSRLGPAMEVGLEYFQREREAGLYDGEWQLGLLEDWRSKQMMKGDLEKS